MDMGTFNVDHAYPEALVRGLRKSFLDENNYTSLKNCGSLADFKLVLEETDYNTIVASQPEIDTSDLKQACKAKLAEEMKHLIAQSVEPLTGFLKMILHGYMIDNVVNIIEGIKNNVDLEALFRKQDPLGYFPEMKNCLLYTSPSPRDQA